MNWLPLLTNFRFAHPWLLLGLLALPLLALAAVQQRSQHGDATLRFPSLMNIWDKNDSRSWRIQLLPLLPIMRWLGLALLVVGLARPQSGSSRQVVQGEGIDIMLVLDMSHSMSDPYTADANRLQAAQTVIQDFVQGRNFDRIGLVVFANNAFVQAPLTVDHDVLLQLLARVDTAPNMGVRDGTAIGMGLVTAGNMLKESDASSRIAILLTDGANNVGEIDPFTAAEAMAALDIKVYTVGMGRKRTVQTTSDGTFASAVGNFNEPALQQIAEMTDGLYFLAEDIVGLQRTYNEINRLERSDIEFLTFNDYNELAAWVIVPGLLLLLAELILRHTIFRRVP